MMEKVLAIVGPTSIGKTSFGIKCAKIFNGEIISGDSIQVYRGFDIGSAKVSEKERDGVIHHLIDIKEPNENYNVSEFQKLARKYIEDITIKNKLPIIVGGTGLYIKATLYDYKFLNEKEEDNEYDYLSNEEIYEILKNEDPDSLATIHINNRKRLLRALNVLRKHKIGLSDLKKLQKHECLYDALIIGLTKPREEIYKQIDKRVDAMIEKGLLKEIENLLKSGITFENQAMQAIGYKEFKSYFVENGNLDECINNVKRNTKHFIKRQYTWFNNQFDVLWFEDKEEALARIRKWYE